MIQEELPVALGKGDPQRVLELIRDGANIHYRREGGYDALIDACFHRDLLLDQHLMDLMELLIDQGVNLHGKSDLEETALKRLSLVGRFDIVQLLLNAGANMSELHWTPLMEAVTLGSLSDVQNEIDKKPHLEDRDHWYRTAWLLAVMTGDIAKAKLLKDHGVDSRTLGHCHAPSLFYAIRCHHVDMLKWLIKEGADVHQTMNSAIQLCMKLSKRMISSASKHSFKPKPIWRQIRSSRALPRSMRPVPAKLSSHFSMPGPIRPM